MSFNFRTDITLESIFQPYLITSLSIMAVIAIVCIIIGKSVSKLELGQTPSKINALAISFVNMLNGFAGGSVGYKAAKWVAPNIITLALMLLIFNISGLFALDTPTKYLAITVPSAVFAIITVQGAGIISKKHKHVNTLFEPVPFLFPINLMGDFTPIISMSFRLFGNIASGAILASMIYDGLGWMAIPVMPLFHVIFDIFFGLIQTALFVILTTIFSSNKVDEKDLLKE
ncbi:F0F1 ATP synthase subunit A [Acholeplasma sp. OttesenSCG-928-E16]|nr:F0F1 ATP synthase subunit A [Acholeplasma sp. OttesenSCG-928-E16]